jgi:ketosteroid isomerase-like protein
MMLPVLLMLAAAAPSVAEMNATADAFDAAQLHKDAAAMDRMIDPDLVFIESTGKRSNKADFIAGWTGAGDRYDPIVLIDRTMQPLGRDAFVTSSETTLSGISGGEKFSSHFRFSDTFRRTASGWRATHIQVTRIK